MPDRKDIVLAAIIQTFIKHAKPVGSQNLLEQHSLGVSPATIRNDMMRLEQEGFIMQPFTSAGRIPTELGLRKFVDELIDDVAFIVPAEVIQRLKEIDEMQNRVLEERTERKVKEAVSALAELSENVSFATLPWLGDTYYLGLANMLIKPEFHDALKVSTVVQFLEDKEQFLINLEKMGISNEIKIFIGHENMLEAIQSCTLIAVSYRFSDDLHGVIGILGPMRMQYARNIAALQAIKDDVTR